MSLSVAISERRSSSSRRSPSSSSTSNRVCGLYGWGANVTGQLGQGPDPKERVLPTILLGFDRVTCFDCNGSHTAIVAQGPDNKSLVYTCGRNDSQQCGLGDEYQNQKIVNIPAVVGGLRVHKVVQVACGGAHTAAVTAQGNVFTWGWGSYGQLGHGVDVKEQATPREVVDLSSTVITSVQCGAFHTAFFTKTRCLYTCGMGSYGQLGLGDTENRWSPVMVEFPENRHIRMVSCGETHTAAISTKGECYTWGGGDSFQLGHGEKANELLPRRVEFFNERAAHVQHVSCGARHSAAVTDDGYLYVWGTGDHGELGLGDDKVRTVPALVEALGNTTVRSVQTSVHFTAIITDTGELYICGSRMHGFASSSSHQSTPRRVPSLSEQFVVDIKAGTGHLLTYIDSGDMGRNRIIGRLIQQCTKYVRALGLVARVVSPVAEAIAGIDAWRGVISRLKDIWKFHRERVVKPMQVEMEKVAATYSISGVWQKFFDDTTILKFYSEYATSFSGSWDKYLSLLKALPNLGAYMERVFGTDMFIQTGLLKGHRNAEQLQAFLQLPLNHFAELLPHLEELYRATSQASSEYVVIKRICKRCREAMGLIKSSMESDSFLKFLDIIQKFPELQTLVQSHRRFLESFQFSTSDRSATGHTLYLFNDLIVVSSGSVVEPQLDLACVFVKDVVQCSVPMFQLVAPTYTYNVYVENKKYKRKIISEINMAIQTWIDEHPKLRDKRLLTGISILVGDLNQVMPLISKDWHNLLSPRSATSRSSGQGSSKRIGFDTDSQSVIQQNLNDIGDLLSKTSGAIELEGKRRERHERITTTMDSREKFVVVVEVNGGAAASVSISKGSSLSRAFTRKRRPTIANTILTNLGGEATLRTLSKNYRVGVRVDGECRVGTAKELLYNLARDSPLSGMTDAKPLSDYILRVKSLDLLLVNEDLPLNRIPAIQTILTTTFVTPVIELVLRPTEAPARPNLDSELEAFEEITQLVGNAKTFVDTANPEINSFRHASAHHRLMLYETRKKNNAEKINKFPEYKGLEALPLKLPTTLNITVYMPHLGSEKHIIQVSPHDTILLIVQRLFRYVYKHDKHKGREKFKKFLKNIVEVSDENADTTSDESDDMEYSGASVEEGRTLDPTAAKSPRKHRPKKSASTKPLTELKEKPEVVAEKEPESKTDRGEKEKEKEKEKGKEKRSSQPSQVPPKKEGHKEKEPKREGPSKKDSKQELAATSSVAAPQAPATPSTASVAPSSANNDPIDDYLVKAKSSEDINRPRTSTDSQNSPSVKRPKSRRSFMGLVELMKSKTSKRSSSGQFVIEEQPNEDRIVVATVDDSAIKKPVATHPTEPRRAKSDEFLTTSQSEGTPSRRRPSDGHARLTDDSTRDSVSLTQDEAVRDRDAETGVNIRSPTKVHIEARRSSSEGAESTPPEEGFGDMAPVPVEPVKPKLTPKIKLRLEEIVDHHSVDSAMLSSSDSKRDSPNRRRNSSDPVKPMIIVREETSARHRDKPSPLLSTAVSSGSAHTILMHSKAPVEIHDDSSIPRERIEASASGPSSDVPPVRDRIDTDSPLKSSSERLFKTEKNSSSIDKSDEKPRGSLLFTDEGTSEDETTAASGMSEKEKKAKKEEEKLRKEKEREEKKIKKEEEKLRREKEKEERRAKKEQEKQTKRDADRKKKEEKKSKPKIKEKRTSNGKGIDDFVLKVYGSKEYFLPGTSNNLNKLLDYDYICKCINNQQPIDLMYVEKYSEMGSVPVSARLADLDDMAIDGAIARETSETEVTEIYLEREFMPSKPFWSFAGDRSEFQIKILDCENVSVESDYKNRGGLFVVIGLYYGGRPITGLHMTEIIPTNNAASWNQEITFDLPMANLPRESRLCFTVYFRPDASKQKKKILKADQPLGWVNCQVFDYSSEIRWGVASFKLWEKAAANPIGTSAQNSASSNPPILFVDLHSNRVETPNSTLRKVKPPKTTKLTNSQRPKDKDASEREVEILKQLTHRDPLIELTKEEQDVLWQNQVWCKKHPSSLPQFLLAVDWGNREHVAHVHRLLEAWPLLHPMDALRLLDFKYPDRAARAFAVKCLGSVNDSDLYRILLQLTQALKFESYHYSALAEFLIRRSFFDTTRVGHFFFWQLKSELHNHAVTERFSLLLESYLKSCGKHARRQLIAQIEVTRKLNAIAVEIKTKKGSLSDKREKLQAMLKKSTWPAMFMVPLDPRVECNGFILDKCKVLGSKTAPLFLAFQNAETGEAINVIYKVGDDLRQDQLTLQIITLMDDLWKREGVDLRLKPYGCLALDDDAGLIEVVRNSNTTSNINIELGGVRAVYNENTLVKWLKKHNITDRLYARAVENFMFSCAGYSVITFVLGLADRHNDNIMLTKDGKLFHIDFGHFLGHYRKLLGKYVDKADLVFIPQYSAVIGKEGLPEFERVCAQAYNVIRKHANYIFTLFSLMLSCGLPELESVDDIAFVKDRLMLNLSTDEAADYFVKKLQDAQDNGTIKLNHAIHVFYQGMRG